ncbi:hypothetical protein L2E82_31819 [Cichorium intybus]|uniref:Uncharacterized protein n=1 Tax=Cichorium intybus TaxID=13427 RepID=A0ACB9BEA4_CICIN|nr:hypothetical protein L2E82_31819 [Cichorium intybus]
MVSEAGGGSIFAYAEGIIPFVLCSGFATNIPGPTVSDMASMLTCFYPTAIHNTTRDKNSYIQCRLWWHGAFNEQLPEQLAHDDKFSIIDSFVVASFQGSNGLSVTYQLPRGEDFSLADVFGLIEQNRNGLGTAEYSIISQSTLETIFSHFAANSS